MDTSKMESTDIRQVEEMLLAQLKSITDDDDKLWMVSMLKMYVWLLYRTQKLQVLHRLKFFDCTYIVFSFLHLNGQLKRHKKQFDEECDKDLDQMFKRLYGRI